MGRPIAPRLITESGTVVEHSRQGGMALHLRAAGARTAAVRLARESDLDLRSTEQLVDVIGASADRGELANLSAIEKRVILEGLLVAGERAAKADEWTLLEKIFGWILGLGYLFDWLFPSEAERTMARVDHLKAQLNLGQDVAEKGDLSRISPDISGVMNLVAHSQLPAASKQMAQVFGGPFADIDDTIATHDHSDHSPLQTSNFEVSSGTRLIDTKTRQLVSYDSASSSYATYALDGRRVFSDGDRLFFEAAPGGRPIELSDAEATRVTRTEIPASRVGARFAQREDPPARPDLPFNWRGYPTSAKVDVSWWGQCHASAMVGALSLSAAAQNVTIFDEDTQKLGEISSDTISAMVVYMGDGAFQTIDRIDGAGRINRGTTYDDDPPLPFHEFVSRHIAEGLPFVIEKYALDQIWNYPVKKARITPEGKPTPTAQGSEQKYAMQITTADDSSSTYYYSIITDAAGHPVDSKWDMPRNIDTNGKTHAVPDVMIGYLGTEPGQTWQMDAGSTHARSKGLTRGAADLITDLYFASRATPLDAGDHVYVVRKKDGSLLQLNQAEFARYPKP